jgi:hypothetical protein
VPAAVRPALACPGLFREWFTKSEWRIGWRGCGNPLRAARRGAPLFASPEALFPLLSSAGRG